MTTTKTHTRTETLEERFVRQLEEALETGVQIQKCRETVPSTQPTHGYGTRENALAVTNAEQGLLWAKKDLEDKNQEDERQSNRPPVQ